MKRRTFIKGVGLVAMASIVPSAVSAGTKDISKSLTGKVFKINKPIVLDFRNKGDLIISYCEFLSYAKWDNLIHIANSPIQYKPDTMLTIILDPDANVRIEGVLIESEFKGSAIAMEGTVNRAFISYLRATNSKPSA